MQGGSQRGTHLRKYGQLCQSLLDLELAAETIFDTITSRVSLEHHCLKTLQNRVHSVQSRVEAIIGTSRATTVFSSSKYPVIPAEVQDFSPLFGGKAAGTYTDFPITTISLSGGQCQGEGTYELYRFFTETSYEAWSMESPEKGIGSLPTNVKSVVDALLFNTTELPYLKYRYVDNLLGSEKLSVRELTAEPIILPPAPPSVQDGGAARSSASEDFVFRPVLGQAPSFTLPSMLPDLPMVAEISWSGTSSALPELKVVEISQMSLSSESKPQQPPPVLLTQPAIPPHSLLPILSQPLPLPPQTERAIPRPPPLLAHSLLPFASGSEARSLNAALPLSSEQTYSTPPLPLVDPARAALLSSIRDPSITLRKISQSNERRGNFQPLQDQTDTGSSRHRKPVNLLAEMATTLKMRRLSMQGATHDKEQVTIRSGEQYGLFDNLGTSGPSSSSGKFLLPIANVDAYISKKKEEMSDNDEEWDD